MIILRRAYAQDLESIYQLALGSGFGLTTLPKDRDLLETRLKWVCDSFDKQITQPEDEYYLFVLEDTQSKAILGISGIISALGVNQPFYSYQLTQHTESCPSLNLHNDYELLTLMNDYVGCSEICTLYLQPDARKNNNGLLLSRARFLFIAAHRQRFCNKLIAEMRGVSDTNGHSPFWDAVGRHFFQLSFIEADQLSLSTNKQFIHDLIPTHPLYVNLLPQTAQAVINQPHEATQSAMNILLREGFRRTGCVDIFDAGPILEANVSNIRTLAQSRVVTISDIVPNTIGKQYLVANLAIDFRATLVDMTPEGDSCQLTSEVAEYLNLNVGDKVQLSLFP